MARRDFEIPTVSDDERYMTLTREELLSEIFRMRDALLVSSRICGNNNCNCPGASKVKAAVKTALEQGTN